MLIDLTRLVKRSLDAYIATGIDRVAHAYIEHYGDTARAFIRKDSNWTVFSQHISQRLYTLLTSPAPPRRAIQRLLLEGMVANPFNKVEKRVKGSILLNLNHTGINKPAYRRILHNLQLRPVYMLHDLIPLSHPEYCRPGENQHHQSRLKNMVETGRGIITNSNDTLSLLKKYASGQLEPGQTLPPSIAAPLGTTRLLVSDVASAMPSVKKPYFVMLSTIEPRKNHWLILQVWTKLVEKLGDNTPTLVLVGRRGWECENIADLLDRAHTLRQHVIELEACQDEELANYLHFAQALLFPSFVEGYGLPVAEALQAGIPVIASDLPVFREFAGDVPEYLSPIDGISWLNAIVDYSTNDHPRRVSQLKKLETFSPSWDGHFRVVDDFLDALHANNVS